MQAEREQAASAAERADALRDQLHACEDAPILERWLVCAMLPRCCRDAAEVFTAAAR